MYDFKIHRIEHSNYKKYNEYSAVRHTFYDEYCFLNFTDNAKQYNVI